MKAGGAYIPMESDYPDDRLLYMLADSEAKIMITTYDLLKEKQKKGTFDTDRVMFIDKLDLEIEAQPINRSKPDSLAYMYYTSGTTNRPKGVMISHAGLKAFATQPVPVEGNLPGDRCAESAPFSFILSVGDIITPLTQGCTIYILPLSLRTDIGSLYRYLRDNKIDIFQISTPIGMELLNKYKLKVKCMLVGGDKMGEITETITGNVLNGYGCTEILFIAYKVISSGCQNTNIPLGRPSPNIQILLLDDSERLVPRGEAGEICIVCPSMAEGYWKKPELTAEKFTECPYMKGKRMYHSGDLARWNVDGDMEYIGRKDLQVELRGVRIELREVENVMLGFDGITKAVVALKEVNGEPHLCGYYISNKEIKDGRLREYLSLSLTQYMVPSFFIRLDEMPLNPNGKVDRKALPVPQPKHDNTVAPRTELEEALFNITSKVLETRDFGITTDLTSMGLTSLGAMNISAEIQNELGLDLKTMDILRNPMICKWKDLMNNRT